MDLKLTDYVPCGKRCVIKLLEEDEKTKSGIIISSSEKPKYVKANLIILGEEVENSNIMSGDLILINRLKIDAVKLEGEEFHIIHYDDITFKIHGLSGSQSKSEQIEKAILEGITTALNSIEDKNK